MPSKRALSPPIPIARPGSSLPPVSSWIPAKVSGALRPKLPAPIPTLKPVSPAWDLAAGASRLPRRVAYASAASPARPRCAAARAAAASTPYLAAPRAASEPAPPVSAIKPTLGKFSPIDSATNPAKSEGPRIPLSDE